jgi:putative ABC transport system permease protein
MLRLLRGAWGRVRRSPLRTSALLVAFAVNAAVLGAVFTISRQYDAYMRREILGSSTRLWVDFWPARAAGQASHFLDFGTGWLPDLKKYAGLRYASPYMMYSWRSIMVDGVPWSVPGEVLGVYPDYAPMCDLKIAAGSFFTDAEMKSSARTAVIAENMARTIWGSATAAIGRTFDANGRESWDRSGTYQVIGVFAEPTAMQARYLQVPVLFVPYDYFASYSGAPGMAVMWMRVQSSALSVQGAQRRILGALRTLYAGVHRPFPAQYDFRMWQGSRSDPYENTASALLGRIKGTSLFFEVMGIFALLVLAFGTLALLSAETQGRQKETGLRRALGSTRNRAMALVISESLVLVAGASIVGDALMLAFIGPLLEAAKPLLAGGGETSTVVFGAGPIVVGMVVAFAASLAAAALAAFVPAWSAARVAPSDALRES